MISLRPRHSCRRPSSNIWSRARRQKRFTLKLCSAPTAWRVFVDAKTVHSKRFGVVERLKSTSGTTYNGIVSETSSALCSAAPAVVIRPSFIAVDPPKGPFQALGKIGKASETRRRWSLERHAHVMIGSGSSLLPLIHSRAPVETVCLASFSTEIVL